MRHKIIARAVFLMLLVYAAPCWGRASGPCSNCHTMHNSQGGAPMAFTFVSGVKTFGAGLNEALLNTNCVGCHQGTNTGVLGSTPFVFQATTPTYSSTGTEASTTTLAGGNFHWVATGTHRAGHNVAGIAVQDPQHLNKPPGQVASLGGQLTCAGTLGCHGSSAIASPVRAVMGGHHGNNMAVWQDGSTVANSYRFLLGVKGFEDPYYEWRPTATQHNKYSGKRRTTETDTAAAEGTISNFCSRCHGDFHNGAGKIASGTFATGVWLRHPVDMDMSQAQSSSEYLTYNGGSGTNNPYSVISPVATGSTTAAVNSTVTITGSGNSAVVMCISCHRAHGSPHASSLRWNYKLWPQATGYNGCAVCHTSKN